MSIAAFVWISLNVHNLLHRNPNPRSVCQSKLSIKKIQKDDFLLSVSVPSFIPPSLILLLVSLLKAVRGHYGKGQGSHSPLPQMARYVHESHKLVIGRWTSSQVNRSAHEIGAWLHSKSKKWVSVIVGKQVVSWMKRIEWMKKLWWDKGTTHLIDMH